MLKAFLRKTRQKVAPTLLSGIVLAGGLVGTTSQAQGAESLPNNKITQKADPQNLQQKIREYNRLIQLRAEVRKALTQEMMRRIEKAEGRVLHPYLDINGLIHVGVGTNIDAWKKFKTVDFRNEKGLPLTIAQKKAYYDQIVAYRTQLKKKAAEEYKKAKAKDPKAKPKNPFNLSATHYAPFFKHKVPNNWATLTLQNHIEMDINNLEKRCASIGMGFYDFPAQALIAMADMEYTLGVGKFSVKAYPKFWQAARHKNFQVMVDECNRKGPPPERNDATRALFRAAALERMPNLDQQIKTMHAQIAPHINSYKNRNQRGG